MALFCRGLSLCRRDWHSSHYESGSTARCTWHTHKPEGHCQDDPRCYLVSVISIYCVLVRSMQSVANRAGYIGTPVPSNAL